MKKALLSLFLLLTLNGFSQLSKTHYIPPLSNATAVAPGFQAMYISTPSTTNVNFKIIQIGGTIITGVVSRDTPFVYDIAAKAPSQLMVAEGNVWTALNNKGFIVEAEDLVFVNVRVTSADTNHAGCIVSKGLAALGNRFRIGAFTNKLPLQYGSSHYTFASILATENNTVVSFGDIKSGVILINNVSEGNFPSQKTLNRGESFVIAVKGPNNFNRDGLIGASITSTKPIAVNCGSYLGSDGAAGGQDIGFDQIVSAERTGKEYIFVKGKGTSAIECPLIVADQDNTEIYLNGSTTPFIILGAGKYIDLKATDFSNNGNLYVRGSKDFFAYQGIAGTDAAANQNMHFVPPLSCETPKAIDNIPFINEVGDNKNFTGTVNIVTETGAVLNFRIKGVSYSYNTLPPGITKKGPLSVNGNAGFVTYTLSGLTGDVSVISTKQVYLSYFGSDANATYGGYYSGFAYKPEINFNKVNPATAYCLPNVKLSINGLSSFEEFQWYFNGNPISGAKSSSYVPTQPGNYRVVGNVKGCSISRSSDEIPVSLCLGDNDLDGVNDYVDADNDNDGIVNCNESLGNLDFDISADTGSISKGNYSNNFTKTVQINGNINSYAEGYGDGTFISQIMPGLTNSVVQTYNFAKPVSLVLEYVQSAGNTNLLNANGDFVLEVPSGSTILVLNPDDQLLIDTNYDGLYESGVKEYSSFQVRFRLRDPFFPLAAGTGTFKFITRLITSFKFTHRNLSDTKANNAIFKLNASCLPIDSDNDGIADEMDKDDDNDGVPTVVETLGENYKNDPFIDINKDGVNDIYGSGLGTLDSDNDAISNHLDLDSDNDGVFDLVEMGMSAVDTDANGMVDAGKTAPALNLNSTDMDSDGYHNYIDSDSDGDDCFDVLEAGFSDSDADGYLGNSPASADVTGKVTSTSNGYSAPDQNYLISGKIDVSSAPVDKTVCSSQNTSFAISSNADSYQWQLSTDGTSFSDITDNGNHSGSKTGTLQIINADLPMDGYKYRVVLNKVGNSCGLISSAVSLKVLSSPTVTPAVSIEKCDYDADGFTEFNLKLKENEISSNSANETFAYYKSLAAAQVKDDNFKIANPQAYNNSQGNKVWARVENANGCFAVSEIDLQISVTQIQLSSVIKLTECDDYLDASHNDKDGISSFDFQSATDQIIASLPNNTSYDVKYYNSQEDALAQIDASGNSLAIGNVNDYRNISYPDSQIIWVRISSVSGNNCDGIGPYLELTVNPLPYLEASRNYAICSGKNDSVTIDAGVLTISNGSTPPVDSYSYDWYKDGQSMSVDDYELTAADEGIYTCTVKNMETGCESKRTCTVVFSKPVKIENVVIDDITYNNKVIVTASGSGEFEYSLDKESGPFQDSNVFENVEPGIHDVYVNDKNGCGVVSQNIAIIGAPPFFTPNGDGKNEYWNLKGVSSSLGQNSKIEIYDRFGKLIYVITDFGDSGWDGTYNGTPLQSNDYWFVVYLGNGRMSKGHFSLKR